MVLTNLERMQYSPYRGGSQFRVVLRSDAMLPTVYIVQRATLTDIFTEAPELPAPNNHNVLYESHLRNVITGTTNH